MSKIKTTCPICGYEAKTDQPIQSCPQCTANLMQTGVEITLWSSPCSFAGLKGSAQAGNLFLTNYRLFWIKSANSGVGAAAGGLLGALAEAAVTHGKSGNMTFCLPLNEIGPLTETKVMLMKALLLTSRTQGDVGRLILKKRDDLRAAIDQAVRQYVR